MKKILVSGASTIVGYGILRSLIKSEKKLQLIGTSIYENSVAQGFCDIFVKAPLTNDINYLDWLIRTVKEYSIDMIIPGIDADMYKWSENIAVIEKTGVIALANNIDLVLFCKDKWAFYERMTEEKCEYAIPSSLSTNFDYVNKEFGLPLLLKPRHGFGSKGIVRVYDKETFLKHKHEIGPILMVQPLIGADDHEYTTSAFCDGKGGFYAYMTLKRELAKDGFTEKAEVVELIGIKEALINLCKIFKPQGS